METDWETNGHVFCKKIYCIQMKYLESKKEVLNISAIIGGKAITGDITSKKLDDHHKHVSTCKNQTQFKKKTAKA